MALSLVCLAVFVAFPHAACAYFADECTQFTNPTTYAAQTGTVATNWQRTLTITQFDRRCGDLQSVSVTFTGGVQGTARYESRATTPFSIALNLAARVHMSLTGLVGGTNPLFSVMPTRSVSDSVGPSDGVLDFGGPSGGTFPNLRAELTQTKTFTGADMGPFLGPIGAAPGLVYWTADAFAASSVSPSASVIQAFLTNASAAITVAYTAFALPPADVILSPSGPPLLEDRPCVPPTSDPGQCCFELTNDQIISYNIVNECCAVFATRNHRAPFCCDLIPYQEMVAQDMVTDCCNEFFLQGYNMTEAAFHDSPRFQLMVDTCCVIPCGSDPVIPAIGPVVSPWVCFQEELKECCSPPVGNTNWPVIPPTVGNPFNPFCAGPGIRSDPHFIAGNGLAYDFMGKAGETYCMFSDQSLHMNMRMVGVKSNPARKATWMDAISIMYFPYYNITIFAESPKGTPFTAAHGTITVNGKAVTSQKLSTLVSRHGLMLKRRKTRVFVSIESLINVEIEVVRAAFWLGGDGHGPGQNYLNFKVVSLNATENVHGVLGQTFRSSFAGTSEDVKGKNGDGVIEGDMADYVSSGLLAADCKMSQFLGKENSWSDSQVVAPRPLRSWVGEAGADPNYSHAELTNK